MVFTFVTAEGFFCFVFLLFFLQTLPFLFPLFEKFIQDLEYLSEGLEGRSSNPVAVLFDTLLHPDADFGYDYPSVLHWKLEQHHYIPHLVLGKGPPGGAWHVSMFFFTFYSACELYVILIRPFEC